MKACRADLLWTVWKSSKFSARMTGRAPLLVAALLAAACSARVAPPEPGARKAIEATVRQYVAASNQGDAEALADLYTVDAMLLPPDHEPIQGREAIGAFWRQGTDQGLEVSMLAITALRGGGQPQAIRR